MVYRPPARRKKIVMATKYSACTPFVSTIMVGAIGAITRHSSKPEMRSMCFYNMKVATKERKPPSTQV